MFFEVHNQAKGTIFEGSICGANYNGVPIKVASVSSGLEGIIGPVEKLKQLRLEADCRILKQKQGTEGSEGGVKGDRVPCHDIIGHGRSTHSSWRVCLHSLESRCIVSRALTSLRNRHEILTLKSRMRRRRAEVDIFVP